MTYIGDFAISSIIYFQFTSVNPATGAPYTLGSFPAVSVYKDDGATESTAGVTLTVDFDGRTGLNTLKIDTSADGTFYATAKDFQAVITTGAVNGVSVVGWVLCKFSLNNRSALRPTTAGRTLVVDAAGLADANMVKMGATGAGTAQTARDIGASVLLSSGSGTGQLDFTSGVVKANLAQILGTALTETAGLLAAGFKQFFNIASPTSTMNVITAVTTTTTATTATNLTNAPTNGDFTAVMKTSLNAATPVASLSAAAITAIWDKLTSTLTTVGSIGKLLVDNVNATISSRLAPTVAGRTLDVSAGGEAGMDWANIGSPTTVQGLSGTTIKDATDVETRLGAPGLTSTIAGDLTFLNTEISNLQTSQTTEFSQVLTDTNDIKSRLPLNLVSGRMDSDVGAMQSDVLTATALAASAVAEIADGVWDELIAGHLGAGSTGEALDDAATGAAVDPLAQPVPAAYAAGTAGFVIGTNLDAAVSTRLATAGYTAPDNASITTILSDTNDIQTRLPAALVSGRMDSNMQAAANGVITAAVIATDAIDSDAIAPSAVTEIQAGLATSVAVAAVQTDTDDIQTRLPAALVGGRMDSSVGAMAANVLTAAAIATGAIDADALATDAIAEIADGVWDELIAGHLGVGSTGEALNNVGTPPSAAVVAAAVEALIADGFTWGECFKIFGAALAGKVSGAPGSPVFRSMNDAANRISATADASGNRTAVTLNP